MEESKKESKGIMIKLIYYLNKNPKQEVDMKLSLLENNKDIIFYEQITYSFCNFLNDLNYNSSNENEIFPHLEEKNINFDYIRYFNGKSWILLDKGRVIIMKNNLTFDILKITIKATILIKEQKNIKNNYRFFNQRIERINTYLNNIESNDISKKAPIYITVLTANPLMNGEEELRTMNDFNIIPGKIYNVLKESEYLNYSTFDVLTKKTFKEAISRKPHILHLIFKSTYIIPEEIKKITSSKDNTDNMSSNYVSSDYVNLIFEKENNYSLEFIKKVGINDLLSDEEEKIKNIILIISTPLSDDVKKIFENFKFKSIIVQHTTLANISLIADFNTILYEDIVLSGLINVINEDNINVLIEHLSHKIKYTICCCFHKHKIGRCEFVKNFLNELYNKNECKREGNIKDEIKEIIPHFCHLMPKCLYTRPCMEDDFCLHTKTHIEKFDLEYKEYNIIINNKVRKYRTICCCYDENNKDDYQKHNIYNSFNCVFLSENMCDNNNSIIINVNINNNVKNNYEKMELVIGRNKDMTMILGFIMSDKSNYNIYGDKIYNLKKFGNIIIEYYKERYYNTNNKDFKSYYFASNDDIDQFNYDYKNKIYFFYLEDINLYDKIKQKDNIKNNRIIWFSEEPLEELEKIKINVEPELKEENDYEYKIKFPPNNYIKYQYESFVRKIWLK